MQWDEFYRYLIVFLVTSTAWSVFKDDLSQQQRGPLGGIKVVSGESNCRFVMIDDIEVDEIVVRRHWGCSHACWMVLVAWRGSLNADRDAISNTCRVHVFGNGIRSTFLG